MSYQHDFILLDRSGSMSTLWSEALGAINGYVKKLADDNVDTGVTLAVFDGQEPFKIVRDRIVPKTWKDVSADEISPRGMIPLNDATMKLLDVAEQGPPWGGKYDKVAIVIMTDGAENDSTEFSIQSGGTQKVKARLDKIREKGWVVQFLGANFDNQAQATSYGAIRASTVQTSVSNFATTMNLMASKRGLYGSSVGSAASMNWSAEEQEALKSDTAVKPEDLLKTTTTN